MSNDEFKIFVEKFYSLLDNIPDNIYSDKIEDINDNNNKNNNDVNVSVDNHEIDMLSKDNNVKSDIPVATTIINMPKNVRRLHGSDITGKDATYAAGYCDSFYDNDIKNVDSEGFLEKLIISRANEKAAPIDLLSEAIAKEYSKNTPANTLRRNIAEIRENADEAAVESTDDVGANNNAG